MGVVIPIYLFLRQNKIFFGHPLAQALHFTMIGVPILMNWDWGHVERVADETHDDKNVCPVWVWYIPSRALLFSFLILQFR